MTHSENVRLLIATEASGEVAANAPRLGGLPGAPDDFTWPLCAEHEEPMQFTAQLQDGDDLVLVFFCQADPGMCDSWDPDMGSNAGIVVPAQGLRLAEAPESETDTAVFDGGQWLLEVRRTEHSELLDAVEAARGDGLTVAGQWHGEPEWIQGDETPGGYRFVAMLEEHPFGFNFGGGAAYVFADDDHHAKVLWQQ